MLQQSKRRPFHFSRITERNIFLSILTLVLIISTAPSISAFQTTPSKIQQSIDAIKEAHYCEDEDYHTDGKRVVWVKSYKKWTPSDMRVMEKEAPYLVTFFSAAIDHKRYDVLEQLLPNYYRVHGGVQAFAADIRSINNK